MGGVAGMGRGVRGVGEHDQGARRGAGAEAAADADSLHAGLRGESGGEEDAL